MTSSSGVVDLRLFWAKTGAGTAHPAVCHMIDVANVVRAFLERPAAAGLRGRLAHDLPGDEGDVARLVAFLAAAHDIGKVSPGFQRKVPDLWRKVADAGYPSSGDEERDHSRTTLTVLKRFLISQRCTTDCALSVARVVAAHHGEFFAAKLFSIHAAPNWIAAQDEHLRALAAILVPDWRSLAALEYGPKAAWLMTLAGLTTVCDWIGSAEELFPFEPDGPVDLPSYATRSLERARCALAQIGLSGWSPASSQLDFEATFGFPPNAVQLAARQAAGDLEHPGFLLLEAPMGLGKTEAALAAADDLLRKHRLTGIYYALPTQATSNQMLGRLWSYVAKRYPGVAVDLHLLHGQSDLNPAYQELRLASIGESREDGLRASDWLVPAKRRLLAPFGVGTVDQALMAAMAVRHMFVRMFGLGDKVVILDEVHAYDTYVSELLDHLVRWLAALGSPVLVLSATLPAARRSALIEAYCGQTVSRQAASYPQIGTVEKLRAPTLTSVDPPPTKDIDLAQIPDSPGEDPRLVAETIATRIAQGGCAAWICNTVERAQQAYHVVRQVIPGDCEHLLFHARFPMQQRLDIERKAVRLFGKDGRRPRRAVLVATQVVEQSLDLDFDVMVSDLAPIDLMLQRAGRLHRHLRAQRPASVSNATLFWLDPVIRDGVPHLGVHEYVYDKFVLLMTWLALRNRASLSLPADVPPLIESVYDDSGTPIAQEVDEALQTVLDKARKQLERTREDEQLQALTALVGRPDAADVISKIPPLVDDDETAPVHPTMRVQTRLSRPSVTIACAALTTRGVELVDGAILDVDRAPDRELVRAIRRSSVTLQRYEWVKYFRTQGAPEAWRTKAPLRNSRLAVFRDGVLRQDGLRSELVLSRELGLVIRKTEGGGRQ